MLGLNLNTSIPFSPFSDYMCQSTAPEDEVDAVTGKSQNWMHKNNNYYTKYYIIGDTIEDKLAKMLT